MNFQGNMPGESLSDLQSLFKEWFDSWQPPAPGSISSYDFRAIKERLRAVRKILEHHKVRARSQTH